MRHGEIAQFRVGSRPTTGAQVSITGISKNANGRVTAPGHGFTTGQKIIHFINYGTTGTMWQMHYRVATITVFDANNYDLNINTSTFDVFNAIGICRAVPHITLNVGSRGPYPVFLFQSEQPFAWYGNEWQTNGYVCCVFDKYLTGDISVGPGMWRTFQSTAEPGAFTLFNPGVPVEVCTALVNELNAMKQAANPGSGAINLWLTIPYAGLLSVDPDYDANENLVVKTIDRCLNGDGGSWAGLTASAALLVEFSNETWNNTAGFDSSYYCARIGQARYATWPGGSSGGFADYNSFSTVRAMAMHQDIATAYPTQLAASRLIRVQGGHSGFGPPVGSGDTNGIRVVGNSNVLGDAWNTGGTAPYVKYEALAWAPYTDATSTNYAVDYPTYKANYAAAAPGAAREAIAANWVALIDAGGDQGNAYLIGTMLPQTAAFMVARGRTTICYEGGYNWDTLPNGGSGNDANGTLFLTGVQTSAAWATSQKALFDAFPGTTGAYHPAIYYQTSSNRWGYNRPNLDNWLGGVEGAGLNQTWTAMGVYNNANDTGGGGGGGSTPAYYSGLPLMLAMRTRIMPKFYPAVVVGAWYDLYSRTLTGSQNNVGGQTIRLSVGTAVYSGGAPATGTKLRVTIQSSSTVALAWDKVYIGHVAPSGDIIDFDGTQVQVLWSGSASGSIAAASLLLSDEITYAFDKTKGLVVTIHVTGVAASAGVGNLVNPGGVESWSIVGTDSAATTDVNTASYSQSLNLKTFPKVEVFG